MSGRSHCSAVSLLSSAQFLLRFMSSGAVAGITEQTRYPAATQDKAGCRGDHCTAGPAGWDG